MNLLANVSTIMSTDLITTTEDAALTEVDQIFSDHLIHHIPVVRGSHLTGIVSKSDYLFFKRGFNDEAIDHKIDRLRLSTHKVSDIMTIGIATLNADDRIIVALEIFKENLFHAIPILEDDKLVGLISTYDIIKNLADDQEATMKYDL